jgi:hypothetical protein
MLDVNLPYSEMPIHDSDWFKEVSETVKGLESGWKEGEFPASFTIFTNEPAHYTPNTVSNGAGFDLWAFGTPHKGAKFPLADKEILKTVLNAYRQRASIPNEFPKD